MRSVLLYFNIFVLATFYATEVQANESESCQNSFKLFIKKSNQNEHFVHKIQRISKDPQLISKRKKVYAVANKLGYSKEQLENLETGLKMLDHPLPNRANILDYLVFAQKDKKSTQALTNFAELNSESPSSSVVKTYQKLQKKADREEEKQYKKLLKEFSGQAQRLTDGQIKLKARRASKAYRLRYTNNRNACRAKGTNATKIAAAKTYTKFTIQIGLVSSVIGYTTSHWDDDKDLAWFHQLFYELGFGIVSGKIKSKVISHPTDGLAVKTIKNYVVGRSLSFLDSRLYSLQFDASKDVAKAKLEKLIKSEIFNQRIKNLAAIYNDKSAPHKWRDDFFNNAAKFLKNTTGIDRVPLTTNDLDWSKISVNDIENPKVRALILKTLLFEQYKKEQAFFKMGDKGWDRFTFHSLYSMAALPHDMPKELIIYSILCNGALNPKKALLQALLIYTVDRLIMDQVYYGVRKKAIDQ
jgi:hypothetical protein